MWRVMSDQTRGKPQRVVGARVTADSPWVSLLSLKATFPSYRGDILRWVEI